MCRSYNCLIAKLRCGYVKMNALKESPGRQLAYVGITAISFLALNAINEWMFLRLEHSPGINWVFLPAGIRLLATLLCGFAGFVGLLLASFYLNFHHFAFADDVRAISGALAGAGGPYLAYLFAKHWYNLGSRLKNLTAPRLLITGILCGLMSPAFHHAFMWVQTGLVDWFALAVMIAGDIVGIMFALYLAKGVIKLTDPREVEDYHG